MKELTKLHLSLTPDELEMLKKLARESQRSMSGQLRHMIRFFYKVKEAIERERKANR